ncbi:uncharacterized protein LOC130712535 [Lotus japonicus]|uniref:uncharacterized protein LOC130712535 n=1 Tax=Lotus japonicus TaxID=34305 RepID=UPI0025893C5F|nr:uncharacterized protein LOC130712535 [Lotus japonicus]
MTPAYDKISNLNPIRDNWNILVRVIRLWCIRAGNQLTGIEMILMDDQMYQLLVQLMCSFSGHYVDELDRLLSAGDPTNDVVVIMCEKIKDIQGKRTIKNGLKCCKIMFNPTFPVAVKFKKKMFQRLPSPTKGVGRNVDASQVSLEDNFINFHERKTIVELKDAGIDMESCYIAEATIKYLLDPQAWWYNVRSCIKTVHPDFVSYYYGLCDRCVVNVMSKHQIRIEIKVIDETDSTYFVIFDCPALILLNRSCSDLIASCEKSCILEVMSFITCLVDEFNYDNAEFAEKHLNVK